MIKNKYIWIFGILVVIVIILAFNRPTKKNIQLSIQPTSYPTTSPTIFPSPTSTIQPFIHSTMPPTSGLERGQITCAYQFPPTPGNFGDAKIEANWNNLVLGKNSTYKLDICLSVNGNNSLLSTNLNQNGSAVVDAPWISPSTDYVFNLYDDHGGSIGTCGGIILSSCQINTNR